jgi:diguanylate cyclase
MDNHYDTGLLALSLLMSCGAMFGIYDFVSHLHRADSERKSFLLPIYAFAVAAGLWGLHFINLMALHDGSEINFIASPVFFSFFVALLGGFIVIYVASQKVMRLKTLLAGGIITGICYQALSYFSLSTLYSLHTLSFDLMAAVVSTLVAITVSTLCILVFAWMKDYSGDNPTLIKLVFALIVSVAILGVHMTFNNAVVSQTGATGALAAEVASNKKMISAIIALALLSLFLLSFVVAIFYEKLGINAFKVSFLNTENNINADSIGYQDALTHLPNRRAFELQLHAASKRSERTGSTIAIAYVDLDHFKPVNDQFGHHTGDAVLIAVAQRLGTAVRGCDSVARLGGDEFVALIEDITSDEDIIPIAERMVSVIKQPFLVGDLKIEISCSVGIAIYPRDGELDKLLIRADAAMYKAKENGKNQFNFYDAEIELASDHLLEMQRDLKNAVENNEFSLLFQPKVDCKTQSPVGAEALIRWNHPTKGIILPITFITAAERFGMIDQINDWVVEETCRTIYRAKKADIDLTVSINLSRQQFRNPKLVEEMSAILKRYDVPASNLIVEIKETTAINNVAQFKLLLAQLKAANIKVALDNFGSQPFALNYLLDLNVDELKLDKLFIATVNEDKASRGLVDAVIRLAHALNLNIVAEGVETEAQRVALAELDCDHMQGYLFSKPIPEEKLFKLFKRLGINFESTGQFTLSDYQKTE